MLRKDNLIKINKLSILLTSFCLINYIIRKDKFIKLFISNNIQLLLTHLF
jgi:hypothetical protein